MWAAIGEVDLARDNAADARDYFTKAAESAPDTQRRREIPPLAPDELLSTNRAQALHVPGTGAALHNRYRAELDPAIAVAIARAWFAGGTVKAAELFDRSRACGEEPNRTALDAAMGSRNATTHAQRRPRAPRSRYFKRCRLRPRRGCPTNAAESGNNAKTILCGCAITSA